MTALLVSVLIPCFNAERFVGAALESVLAQTYAPIEVIVVDDGSTDGSAEVIEQFRARGVTVIHQANAGASAARNLAYCASSGQAVLFMDCDDLISKGHISALAARLDGPHVISMGQWDRFYADPSEATFPMRPTYRDATGPDWLAENGWHMMQSAMFLLTRLHIDAYGTWDEARSPLDDFEFYTRMIAPCDGLRFAPEARLYYRSGIEDSLSGLRSRRYAEGAIRSLLMGIGHLLSVEDSPRIRRVSADVLQNFEYNYYPHYSELRGLARARIAELGGSDLSPDGPPGFHKLRRWIGWRAARRVQRAAERLGLNRAARGLPR